MPDMAAQTTVTYTITGAVASNIQIRSCARLC